MTLKSAQPDVLLLTPMSVARADSPRQKKNTSLPKADEAPSPISPIAKEHWAKSFNPSFCEDQAALWTLTSPDMISSVSDLVNVMSDRKSDHYKEPLDHKGRMINIIL